MQDGFDVTSMPTNMGELGHWMYKVAQDPAAVEVHADRMMQWLKGEGELPPWEAGGASSGWSCHRCECVKALGKTALTTQTAVRILIEALTSERSYDPNYGDSFNGGYTIYVWEEAGFALIAAKVNSVPLLIAALDDPDPLRRQRAIGVLGYLGSLAQPAVPALIRRLTDPVAAVRWKASYALKEICGPNNLVLCALLSSPNPEIVHGALRAIEPLPAELVPFCVGLLEHPEARFRSLAASSLGTAGSAADSASPALLRCLNDPEAGVRHHAIDALAAVGGEDPEAPAALMRAAPFTTSMNGGSAADGYMPALKALRTRAPRFIRMALPELLRLLAEISELFERRLALETVQKVELPLGDLPALLHLAESVLAEPPTTRGLRDTVLVWVLDAIAAEEAAWSAIPLLLRTQTEASERVRDAATETLRQVTQSPKKG